MLLNNFRSGNQVSDGKIVMHLVIMQSVLIFRNLWIAIYLVNNPWFYYSLYKCGFSQYAFNWFFIEHINHKPRHKKEHFMKSEMR